MASKGRALRVISLTILGLFAYLPSAGAQRLSGDRIEALVARQLPGAFETYRELLSLPNDAHFPEDILELLSWLEHAFERRAFATTLLPTGGSPVLLAERSFPRTDRTVLIYLQADGQPVDLSAWNQESPYRPVLKESAGRGAWNAIPWGRLHEVWDPDWRIFARSASDSKGPIAQFLTALDAMDEGGVTPDFNMKVIVDTEQTKMKKVIDYFAAAEYDVADILIEDPPIEEIITEIYKLKKALKI